MPWLWVAWFLPIMVAWCWPSPGQHALTRLGRCLVNIIILLAWFVTIEVFATMTIVILSIKDYASDDRGLASSALIAFLALGLFSLLWRALVAWLRKKDRWTSSLMVGAWVFIAALNAASAPRALLYDALYAPEHQWICMDPLPAALVFFAGSTLGLVFLAAVRARARHLALRDLRPGTLDSPTIQ
jgi:hypothetical protein